MLQVGEGDATSVWEYCIVHYIVFYKNKKLYIVILQYYCPILLPNTIADKIK